MYEDHTDVEFTKLRPRVTLTEEAIEFIKQRITGVNEYVLKNSEELEKLSKKVHRDTAEHADSLTKLELVIQKLGKK